MITYSENNWLHDVQDCVNELSSNDFTLDDCSFAKKQKTD